MFSIYIPVIAHTLLHTVLASLLCKVLQVMNDVLLVPSQVGHTDYVTTLTFITPGSSSWYPEGTIVSGKYSSWPSASPVHLCWL